MSSTTARRSDRCSRPNLERGILLNVVISWKRGGEAASMAKRAARRVDGRRNESIDRCQFQVSRGKKLGNRVSCYA